MPIITPSDMQKNLKEGKIEKLYYLYGRDIAAVETFTAKLKRRLIKPDDEVYCLHRFDGGNLDINELEDTLVSLPFFGEHICVLINDFNADSATADVMKRLTTALLSMPHTTSVIFFITGIDICSGKKNPTPKNKKIIDFIAKNGLVCNFTQKSISDHAKWIISTAKKSDCTIERKTAEKIAEKCLCNSLLIASETAKLCSYANSKEITPQMVDMLVSRQLDSDAFALAKAAAAFDGRSAMSLLSELFELRYEPIVILAAVTNSFLDLYRARTAADTGRRADEISSDFGYRGREFVVNNAMRACRNIPVTRLRECLRILAQTDLMLKSSRSDKNDKISAHRICIEQCIAKILCS